MAVEVVTGMYVFIYILFELFLHAYVYVFCLGAFLVNYHPDLVLFDSRSQYFLGVSI